MKITFIGSGGLGSSTAFACGIMLSVDDIVMIDVLKNHAISKALDLQQCMMLNGKQTKVIGGDDYKMVKDSDIIIITASVAMSKIECREQLLEYNRSVIIQIADKLKNIIPTDDKQPLIIMLSNPMDIMLKYFIDTGGFNKKKTIGSGNLLDTYRFKYYLSETLKIDYEKIKTYCIGQHGAKMVYLLSQTYIDNVSFFEYAKQNCIKDSCIKDIKNNATNGGLTIIKGLSSGGTFYAPAISIIKLIYAYFNDTKQEIPVSVYCNGEYGVKDICFGCPVIIGKNGVEKINILDINEIEKQEIKQSCEFIKSLL